jgi:hypothetical protein
MWHHSLTPTAQCAQFKYYFRPKQYHIHSYWERILMVFFQIEVSVTHRCTPHTKYDTTIGDPRQLRSVIQDNYDQRSPCWCCYGLDEPPSIILDLNSITYIVIEKESWWYFFKLKNPLHIVAHPTQSTTLRSVIQDNYDPWSKTTTINDHHANAVMVWTSHHRSRS